MMERHYSTRRYWAAFADGYLQSAMEKTDQLRPDVVAKAESDLAAQISRNLLGHRNRSRRDFEKVETARRNGYGPQPFEVGVVGNAVWTRSLPDSVQVLFERELDPLYRLVFVSGYWRERTTDEPIEGPTIAKLTRKTAFRGEYVTGRGMPTSDVETNADRLLATYAAHLENDTDSAAFFRDLNAPSIVITGFLAGG